MMIPQALAARSIKVGCGPIVLLGLPLHLLDDEDDDGYCYCHPSLIPSTITGVYRG